MIFPELLNKPFAYVNLNDYAVGWRWHHCPKIHKGNPLLDPGICELMVADCHREYGVAWSFGGYMENRFQLWKDSYLDLVQKPIHLGVDFNVPAGTRVVYDYRSEKDALPSGHVYRIDTDHPEEHGWGTRIIIALNGLDRWLVYAHLDPDYIKCKVGDSLYPNFVIGRVGMPKHNGGWYSHLHVQVLTRSGIDIFANDPSQIDGYGSWNEREVLPGLFPDPLQYIRIC